MTSLLDDLLQWGRVLGTGSLLKKKTQAAGLATHVATSGSDYATYGLGIGTISGWLGYAAASSASRPPRSRATRATSRRWWSTCRDGACTSPSLT